MSTACKFAYYYSRVNAQTRCLLSFIVILVSVRCCAHRVIACESGCDSTRSTCVRVATEPFGTERSSRQIAPLLFIHSTACRGTATKHCHWQWLWAWLAPRPHKFHQNAGICVCTRGVSGTLNFFFEMASLPQTPFALYGCTVRYSSTRVVATIDIRGVTLRAACN